MGVITGYTYFFYLVSGWLALTVLVYLIIAAKETRLKKNLQLNRLLFIKADYFNVFLGTFAALLTGAFVAALVYHKYNAVSLALTLAIGIAVITVILWRDILWINLYNDYILVHRVMGKGLHIPLPDVKRAGYSGYTIRKSPYYFIEFIVNNKLRKLTFTNAGPESIAFEKYFEQRGVEYLQVKR